MSGAGAVPETVDYEEMDNAVVLRLCSPPVNALGWDLIHDLGTALDHVDAAPPKSALVVASAIPGFFAAGADIKHIVGVDPSEFASYSGAVRELLRRIADSERISIAAIEGHALGGGMELAMACTLRVASAEAHFALPEVKLGLIPGAGGTQRLPSLVGRGLALDLMLSARRIGADEARGAGLVDRLVARGAEDAALELADELSRMSQPALDAIVRCVDAASRLPLEQGLEVEAREIQTLFENGEAREGLSAFLERRPARF